MSLASALPSPHQPPCQAVMSRRITGGGITEGGSNNPLWSLCSLWLRNQHNNHLNSANLENLWINNLIEPLVITSITIKILELRIHGNPHFLITYKYSFYNELNTESTDNEYSFTRSEFLTAETERSAVGHPQSGCNNPALRESGNLRE